MEHKAFYVKRIEEIIDKDSLNLSLERVLKQDDGYGGASLITSIVPVKARMYNNKGFNDISFVAGEVINSSSSKLLALASADIKRGDLFILENVKYRVKFVNSYFDICMQCDLEVIEDV